MKTNTRQTTLEGDTMYPTYAVRRGSVLWHYLKWLILRTMKHLTWLRCRERQHNYYLILISYFTDSLLANSQLLVKPNCWPMLDDCYHPPISRCGCSTQCEWPRSDPGWEHFISSYGIQFLSFIRQLYHFTKHHTLPLHKASYCCLRVRVCVCVFSSWLNKKV